MYFCTVRQYDGTHVAVYFFSIMNGHGPVPPYEIRRISQVAITVFSVLIRLFIHFVSLYIHSNTRSSTGVYM